MSTRPNRHEPPLASFTLLTEAVTRLPHPSWKPKMSSQELLMELAVHAVAVRLEHSLQGSLLGIIPLLRLIDDLGILDDDSLPALVLVHDSDDFSGVHTRDLHVCCSTVSLCRALKCSATLLPAS